MYQWWVFVHLAGVFGFLASHGVTMSLLFRLRRERDPGRVRDLLQLSGASTAVFYPSLLVLLAGGIVAGFLGHWWSRGWIWGAVVILVVAMGAMYAVATPYYRRVRLVADAMAEGSSAVTPEQFDRILRSPSSNVVAAVGIVALGSILYLMLFKPTLGVSNSSTVPPPAVSGSAAGTGVTVSATALSFDAKTLTAPASTPFSIVFSNQAPGVAHNVAIYTDSSATKVLFRGAIVTGPKTVTYHVPALRPGAYFFRCDVHPAQMTGSFVVR